MKTIEAEYIQKDIDELTTSAQVLKTYKNIMLRKELKLKTDILTGILKEIEESLEKIKKELEK